MLFIDLETRSNVDLTMHGAMRYALDTSTQVICISYAFSLEGEVKTWFADDSDTQVLGNQNKKFPADLLDYILNSDEPIVAHNAEFERLIFEYVLSNDYDFDAPHVSRWQCTQIQALTSGLPASLANLSRVLPLDNMKQLEGKRLIDDYSAAGAYEEWAEGDKELMRVYCEYDVLASRDVYKLTRRLSDTEWTQYHATQIMNDRGVPFDVEFAHAATQYADEIKEDVDSNIKRITGGFVPTAGNRKNRAIWLEHNLTEAQYKSLLKTKTKDGEKVTSLCFDEANREKLAQFDDLPGIVHEYLDQIQYGGGSAIKKYYAIDRLNIDGNVYGSLLFNGAVTGRYTAKGGLQIQNFKACRLESKEVEELILDVKEGYAIEAPAQKMAQLLRPTITCTEGVTYSDYSQIEARVLPWLYPCAATDSVLDVFREGKDLYKRNAVGMFDLAGEDDVTKDLRQAAKVATLGCGFGGGAGAIHTTGLKYGLTFTDAKANEIKDNWRKANPWAKRLWEGLKSAAQSAVYAPGREKTFGRITFVMLGDVLYMRLPSGRYLGYQSPRIETVEVGSPAHAYHFETEEITALKPGTLPARGQKDWPRKVVNFLLLAENATQAVAADIMRESIVRAVDYDIPVIFSVHDELIARGNCVGQLSSIMETAPAWADGLPIKTETGYNLRYGK